MMGSQCKLAKTAWAQKHLIEMPVLLWVFWSSIMSWLGPWPGLKKTEVFIVDICCHVTFSIFFHFLCPLNDKNKYLVLKGEILKFLNYGLYLLKGLIYKIIYGVLDIIIISLYLCVEATIMLRISYHHFYFKLVLVLTGKT